MLLCLFAHLPLLLLPLLAAAFRAFLLVKLTSHPPQIGGHLNNDRGGSYVTAGRSDSPLQTKHHRVGKATPPVGFYKSRPI